MRQIHSMGGREDRGPRNWIFLLRSPYTQHSGKEGALLIILIDTVLGHFLLPRTQNATCYLQTASVLCLLL